MDVLSEILDKVELTSSYWYIHHLQETGASVSRRKRI
nr:hypothetical protein GPGIFMOB_00203 [Acinetobacter gerneri]